MVSLEGVGEVEAGKNAQKMSRGIGEGNVGRKIISSSMCVCSVSQLCLTLCDPMDQARLSMEFSRQEDQSGLPAWFCLKRQMTPPEIRV